MSRLGRVDRLGGGRGGWEDEVEDRGGVHRVMGDEEPGATFGLVGEVREDGDAARARRSGIVGRVVVNGVEERYDWCVDCAFGRFVYFC